MHLITTNIQTGQLDEVTAALLALGVERLRVSEISGYTVGRHGEFAWRGRRIPIHMLPEIELEAVVCDETVDDAVALLIRTLRQTPQGDGFVCVTSVAQCYRISTGHPQF